MAMCGDAGGPAKVGLRTLGGSSARLSERETDVASSSPASSKSASAMTGNGMSSPAARSIASSSAAIAMTAASSSLKSASSGLRSDHTGEKIVGVDKGNVGVNHIHGLHWRHRSQPALRRWRTSFEYFLTSICQGPKLHRKPPGSQAGLGHQRSGRCKR